MEGYPQKGLLKFITPKLYIRVRRERVQGSAPGASFALLHVKFGKNKQKTNLNLQFYANECTSWSAVIVDFVIGYQRTF